MKCVIGVAGEADNFQAPILTGSEVPALLGIRTLKTRRAVIDCFTGRMYLIGAGGYKLKLSPGSRELNLDGVPFRTVVAALHRLAKDTGTVRDRVQRCCFDNRAPIGEVEQRMTNTQRHRGS